jgi:hypothetical protein
MKKDEERRMWIFLFHKKLHIELSLKRFYMNPLVLNFISVHKRINKIQHNSFKIRLIRLKQIVRPRMPFVKQKDFSRRNLRWQSFLMLVDVLFFSLRTTQYTQAGRLCYFEYNIILLMRTLNRNIV